MPNKHFSDEIIILECTFCLANYDWNRTKNPDGFGYCYCKKVRFLKEINKNQEFKVLKEKRKQNPGYVIVMSREGWQKLNAPSYKENPQNWNTYPVKITKS